jgi:hypothetical protein
MSEFNSPLENADHARWLRDYYFARAAVSVGWTAAAVTIGQHSPAAATALLVAYPAWDAAANYWDASHSGGIARNRTQTTNIVVSLTATVVVAAALLMGMNWVLGALGAWATIAGLLQLGTAIRRWKTVGAQWAMIVSGAQSAVVGGLFIAQAQAPMPSAIKTLAGYAITGAAYFLISAVWLTVKERRRASATAPRS